MIIGVYVEIAGFLSPRLYIILKPLYKELSEAERERFVCLDFVCSLCMVIEGSDWGG